jgi:hypothetical protein
MIQFPEGFGHVRNRLSAEDPRWRKHPSIRAEPTGYRTREGYRRFSHANRDARRSKGEKPASQCRLTVTVARVLRPKNRVFTNCSLDKGAGRISARRVSGGNGGERQFTSLPNERSRSANASRDRICVAHLLHSHEGAMRPKKRSTAMARPATESDKKHGDVLEDVVDTVGGHEKEKRPPQGEDDRDDDESVQDNGTDFGNVDESDSN